MKKFSFLALAAAGLLFGACSDKDEVAKGTPVNLEDFQDGAYIGISLSLPSAESNTTRANDELSNGIEDEFEVKNATLYIFRTLKTSGSEATATLVDHVTLGTTYNPDQQGGIDPNDEWGVQTGVDVTKITSTSLNEATKISNQLAAKIKSAAETYNFYAYVILNHNGQIPTTLTYDDDANNVTGTTFQTFSRSLFSEIGADIAAEQNIYSNKGLLMTNAPICSVSGGSAAPSSPTYSTLVTLDPNKITNNAETAKQNPAACVYVERAAVKITVESSAMTSGTTPTLGGYDVAIDGWQVINNEEKFFNTRQINYASTTGDTWTAEDWGGYINVHKTTGNNKYRFVSLYKFEPQQPEGLASGYKHTTGYRTYFAADPHYEVDAVTNETSVLKNTVASNARPWIALNKHAYTTENTFDVKHQTWQNTTMVTVKTHLSKTENNNTTTPSFYTVGKGGQTMYDDVEVVKAVIHNIVMNDADVAAAVQNLLNLISKNNPSDKVTAGLNVDFTAPNFATTGVRFNVTPAFKLNDAAYATYDNTKKITDTTDPLYSTIGNKTESDLKDALQMAIYNIMYKNFNASSFNDLTTDAAKTGYLAGLTYKDPMLMSYYKDGVSYYNVRIKHFGDAETPWSADDVVAGGSGINVNEIYFNTAAEGNPAANIPTGQKNFLGRYGLVRDNWYKLDITAITKIGSATPEDPSIVTPDTPDDEIENYISVHVHIVPWVLRSQTVIL